MLVVLIVVTVVPVCSLLGCGWTGCDDVIAGRYTVGQTVGTAEVPLDNNALNNLTLALT